MAILAQDKIGPINAALASERVVGWHLWNESFKHFTQYLGHPGIGLSYGSCNAAVAVNLNASYGSVDTGRGDDYRFSVVYGSSRLFSGLDPDFNRIHPPDPCRPFSNSDHEEHAEQSAIRTAVSKGLSFYEDPLGHNHIYIDLTPCPKCGPWLIADSRNWHVHYFTELNAQAPVINEKKRARSDTFGRQTEKRPKTS